MKCFWRLAVVFLLLLPMASCKPAVEREVDGAQPTFGLIT